MGEGHNPPMHNPESVMVYDYEYWDPERSQMLRSLVPATLEAIKSGLGIPLLDTGRPVARTDLDGFGRATRVRQRPTP